MTQPRHGTGKFTGLGLDLPHAGQVCLRGVVAHGSDTFLYETDCPGVVVKVFDLDCSKADEISYGPYLGFKLELANYEEIQKISDLSGYVPPYHGAHIDYDRKYAAIALGYLEGQDLKSWCEEGVEPGQENRWIQDFRRSMYETLAIMRLFHRHGVILLDLKPENIFRLRDGAIRFVDLGALFTRRHAEDLASYVYSATPEHAEVLIDASNLQSGLPPTEASDVFSAGVALFEMATGTSRLLISDATAQEILDLPELYRFLDSQIRDVWHGFPHLRSLLPLVQTQLSERRLLFSELWQVLKAYLAHKVPGWEGLAAWEQDQMLLGTGTTFIREQLPEPLAWLAEPIAQATVLRTARVKSTEVLMQLLAEPVGDDVRSDLEEHNGFVAYVRAGQMSADPASHLNSWDVHQEARTGHWSIGAASANHHLGDNAQFVFLKEVNRESGSRFYSVVDELEAHEVGGSRLTLSHLAADRTAWLI